MRRYYLEDDTFSCDTSALPQLFSAVRSAWSSHFAQNANITNKRVLPGQINPHSRSNRISGVSTSENFFFLSIHFLTGKNIAVAFDNSMPHNQGDCCHYSRKQVDRARGATAADSREPSEYIFVYFSIFERRPLWA